jgi:hypothetical protein
VESGDIAENTINLFPTQDRRQTFFSRRLDDFQDLPVALDDIQVK